MLGWSGDSKSALNQLRAIAHKDPAPATLAAVVGAARTQDPALREAATHTLDDWKARGLWHGNHNPAGCVVVSRPEGLTLIPGRTAKELEALAGHGQLGPALAEMDYGVFDPAALQGVSAILRKAASDDALQAELRPHLQALTAVPERARRLGTLDQTGYEAALVEAFPEVLDETFMRAAVADPVNAPKADILATWCARKPELCAPMLEQLASGARQDYGQLFLTALTRYDYQPNPRTLGWLVSSTLAAAPRMQTPTDWEPRYLLGALVEVKKRFPEQYQQISVGPDRRPLGDHLLESFRDGFGYIDDGKFRWLAEASYDPFLNSFTELTDLGDRWPEMLDDCRRELAQHPDAGEAPPRTLATLGLLARQAPHDPDLREELTSLLALTRAANLPSLRDLALELLQGRELQQQLAELDQQPESGLAARTAFLLGVSRTLKHSHHDQSVLNAWKAAVEQTSLRELPTSFANLDTAFSMHQLLDASMPKLSPKERLERLKVHLALAHGDLDTARSLFAAEAEMRGQKTEWEPAWNRLVEFFKATGDLAKAQEMLSLERSLTGTAQDLQVEENAVWIGGQRLDIQ
ncbi:MAG: hypothetical protein KC910_27750 [Candidatus Eremiobacteraeota bacterium]|nr:hypothetical protein [Candidatus Eremiobacteraeota bacterium]